MKTPISQWSVPILASWAITATCTFDPHPKSGVQACSPGDGLCPHGYVCAADNMCWLPEDLGADAGSAGAGGETPSAGGTLGAGGATGGSPTAGGAGGVNSTGGVTGGSPAAGGAAGRSQAAGGSVATGGTSTTGGGTCAVPSTYGTCSTGVSCGGTACCASTYSYYCPETNKCWMTQEEAVADCGSAACAACATPTNICPPSPGTGTCSNAGDLWCSSGTCCDSAHPYNCPATNLCYQTATAAAAACGGTACSSCKTTSACTKTCPAGQTLDTLSCTCNKNCTNVCPNGGTPSGSACQCPTCSPCFNGGTPSPYPACTCPRCTNICTGGGTPSAYPACTCPTPICTRTCPPGQFLNSSSCTCL